MDRIQDILSQLNSKERMQQCYKLNQEYISKLRKHKKKREENNYSRKKYYKKNKK